MLKNLISVMTPSIRKKLWTEAEEDLQLAIERELNWCKNKSVCLPPEKRKIIGGATLVLSNSGKLLEIKGTEEARAFIKNASEEIFRHMFYYEIHKTPDIVEAIKFKVASALGRKAIAEHLRVFWDLKVEFVN